MKKTIATIAAAGGFALLAHATETYSPGSLSADTGTDFSTLTSGATFTAGTTGGGDGTANDAYWYAEESGSFGIVTNTADIGTQYADPNSVGRPFDSALGNGLALEADQRLYRTANASAVSTDSSTTNYTVVSFQTDAVYFDSMVLFTPTDTAPTPDSDDKLVVWLYGAEDENPPYGASTNLVITAATFKNGELTNPMATNYFVSASDCAIAPNSWHRLTIKASVDSGYNYFDENGDVVAASASNARPVFEVYVDGVQVAGDLYNSQIANTKFPSMAAYAGAEDVPGGSLFGVAFQGTGAVDDIKFTTTAPSFTLPPAETTFNLVVQSVDDDSLVYVTNVSYTVNSGDSETLYANEEGFSGNAAWTNQLEAGTAYTVAVSIAINNTNALTLAVPTGWTETAAGSGIYTNAFTISNSQAAGSTYEIIFTIEEGESGETDIAADGTDGSSTITIPAAVASTFVSAIESTAEAWSTVPETTSSGKANTLSYAQAWALGLLSINETTGDAEVADLPAVTITFDASGNPVVSMASTGTVQDNITVTCTLKAIDDLAYASEWTGETQEHVTTVASGVALGGNLTDTTANRPDARFYKVFLSISDSSN